MGYSALQKKKKNTCWPGYVAKGKKKSPSGKKTKGGKVNSRDTILEFRIGDIGQPKIIIMFIPQAFLPLIFVEGNFFELQH